MLLWKNFFNSFEFDNLDKNILVLEPMCGYSEGLDILKNYSKLDNFEYEGFDYSDEIVKLVKNKKDINVYVMDMLKFKSDKKFDIIIIIGGLHHIPYFVEETLKIINDSLQVGGYFINFEPTHNSFITKLIRDKIYRSNDLFDTETEKDFRLDQLNKIYFNNGFHLLHQEYPGLLAYILYYNPDAFPFLNIGNKYLVRFFNFIDLIITKTGIGKKLSFATLSVMTKYNK